MPPKRLARQPTRRPEAIDEHFFLVDPLYTFAVSDAGDLVSLFALLAAGATAGDVGATPIPGLTRFAPPSTEHPAEPELKTRP